MMQGDAPASQVPLPYRVDVNVHEACYHRKAIPAIPLRIGARLRTGLAFAHRNEAVNSRLNPLPLH